MCISGNCFLQLWTTHKCLEAAVLHLPQFQPIIPEMAPLSLLLRIQNHAELCPSQASPARCPLPTAGA